MVNFIDRQILSILANDIKLDLGINDAQLGFLYGTAFAVFYAVFGIPLGWLADRQHRLRLLSGALLLWSIMTMLSGLTKNFAQLAAARVGVGVGEAAANPCAYSLISDWFPSHLRATALSVYSAGLFLGSGLSLVLGGVIVDWWNTIYPTRAPLGLAGWQVAFLFVGTPGILLAFCLLMMREPLRCGTAPQADLRAFAAQLANVVPPFTLISARIRGMPALLSHLGGLTMIALIAFILASVFDNALQFATLAIGTYCVFSWATAARQKDPATFAAIWGNSAFLGLVLGYSAVCYIGYTAVYWAAPYAERVFQLSKTELGIMIGAANALGGFVGVIIGGIVADRVAKADARKRLVVPLFAIILPIPLLGIGYSTTNVALFVGCNLLTQMATSSALGASAAATQALVAPHMRGTATAVFLLGPTLIGLGLGPFMAGYVSEVTGSLALGVKWSLAAAAPGLIALYAANRHYSALQ